MWSWGWLFFWSILFYGGEGVLWFIPLVRLFSIQSPSLLFQFHFSVRTLIQFLLVIIIYFFLQQSSFLSPLIFLSLSLHFSNRSWGARAWNLRHRSPETSQFRSGYECLAVDKGRKTIAEERGLQVVNVQCRKKTHTQERETARQTERERHRSFGGFCTARITRSLLQFPPSLALCRNLFLTIFIYISLSLFSLPNLYSQPSPPSFFYKKISHDSVSTGACSSFLYF